ncbi:MAG: transcriptional regulator, TetR family [Paenibacillaceae bacterium]|jgi:AcrR family transcriptional regulator|nr:transcriptional regulator, TetR family [Paenibacillaceae bacterium]
MSSAKERILLAAVGLFNEHGTGKVSTNHIAAGAGMSPGNLYYHYKNKEEIIRGILEQMYTSWTPVWSVSDHMQVTEEDLRERLLLNFQILWEYRFFYREAVVLLQSDERLQREHTRMMERRMEDQETFVSMFIRDGVLRKDLTPVNLRKLLTAAWIIANNWLGFLEMNGTDVSPERFQEGAELIWSVFAPYLAADVHREEG